MIGPQEKEDFPPVNPVGGPLSYERIVVLVKDVLWKCLASL